MAKALPLHDHLAEEEEEDYIDMDVSSVEEMDASYGNSFLCYTIVSPPHPNEFEFQMSVKPAESEATTSPADELFYKGKLLPLHLPPRLQMVEKLLQNSKEMEFCEEEKVVSATTTTNGGARAPFESCNISPASSCYVSGELNAEDYHKCSAALVRSNQKSSWCKKLESIKQLSQSLKLKASKAYLKSLFNRRRCSDEKAKESSSGNEDAATKNTVEQIKIRSSYLLDDTNALCLARSIVREKHTEEDVCRRKSFSGAINWSCPTAKNSSAVSTLSSASSSSSSSFSATSSNGLSLPLLLNRSGSSVNAEVESSIQGAIAHCKRSQQMVSGRKSASDIGFCSSSSPIIAAACENQERPGLCRG